MPRNVDPGTLTAGTGLAADESIETNAFVNPTGGNEGLRVHIVDPSRAHEARAINLEDAGGFYVGDHVEAALQEIGGGASAGRSNGLIEGGTFSVVGLTATLNTTEVFLNGNAVSFTGQSVTLLDNTTNYVTISSTGVLSTSASIPVGGDPVFLREFVTVGGAVTDETDMRLFVLNLDRKLPFVVRNNLSESLQDRSEASCMTLEAVAWHLDNYGPGGDTERHTVYVRGQVTITEGVAFTVPVIIRGEGAASIRLTTSAATPALDLSGAGSQVHDLTFTANVAGATALRFSNDDSVVSNVKILSGSSDWDTGILFTGDPSRNRVNGVYINQVVDNGISFSSVTGDCFVENCQIVGAGAGTATYGINFYNSAASPGGDVGYSHVSHCSISGFDTGVFTRGNGYRVTQCAITGTNTGVDFNLSGTTGADQGESFLSHTRVSAATVGVNIGSTYDFTSVDDVSIRNAVTGMTLAAGSSKLSGLDIAVSTTTGVTGIAVTGDGNRISKSVFRNERTWTTEVDEPVGILLDAGSTSISDVDLTGWYNDGSSPGGSGVKLNSGTTGTRIRDCRFLDCYYGVWDLNGTTGWSVTASTFSSLGSDGITNATSGGSQSIRITDNIFNTPGDSSAISLVDSTDVDILGNSIDGDSAPGGGLSDYGIQLSGSDSAGSRLRRVTVSNNNIRSVDTAGVFLDGWVEAVVVSGNQIDGFDGTSNPAATGILVTGGSGNALAQSLTITGNTVGRCAEGISCQGNSGTEPVRNVTITGNTVRYCGYAQDLTSGRTDSYPGWGSKGIGVLFGYDITVSGNTLHDIGHIVDNSGTESFPDQGGAIHDVDSTAIYMRNVEHPLVDANTVDGCMSNLLGRGLGIVLHFTSTGVVGAQTFRDQMITNNIIRWNDDATLPGNDEGDYGIWVYALAGTDATTRTFTGIVVNGNRVNRTKQSGIAFWAGDTGALSDITCTGNSVDNIATGATPGEFHGGIQFHTTGSGAIIGGLVSGNTVLNSTEYGIVGDCQGTGAFRSFQVVNNRLDAIGVGGVQFIGSNGTTASFVELSVQDNLLRDYGLVGGGDGIGVTAPATMGGVERVTIRGNDLSTDQTPDDNIVVEVTGGTGVDLFEIDVSDNKVSNNAGGGAPGSSGVRVSTISTGQNTGRRITITDNVLFTSSLPIDVDFDGFIDQAKVSNNMCDGVGGFRFRVQAGSPLVGETYVDDVQITGNSFQSGTGSSSFLIEDGHKIRDLRITDNIIRDTSTALNMSFDPATLGTGAAILNMSILDNSFEVSTGVGLALDASAGSQTDAVVNVAVSRNTFHRVNTATSSAAIQFDTFSVPQNISINENQFRQCGSADSATEGTLEFRVGGSVSRGLALCGNNFSSCTSHPILVQENAAASTTQVVGLSVCGNQVHSSGGSILLDMSAFNVVEQIQINDNTVEDVQNDWGIELIGSDTQNTENVSVCSNMLVDVGGTSTGGIQIITGHDIENVTINGNTIRDADGHGINVQVDGLLDNVTVSGNTIKDVDERGINVALPGTDAGSTGNSLIVTGNNIQDTRGSPIMTFGISVSVDEVTSTPDLDDLVITDNIVQRVADTGIRVSGSSAANVSDFSNVVVSNNTIEGDSTAVGDGGILFSISGDLENATLSQNMIQSVGGDGISLSVFDALVRNLSVIGNCVRDYSRATSGNPSGIDLSLATNARGVTVSNNIVQLDSATKGVGSNPFGINFTGTDSQIWSLSVLDNNCYGDDVGVTGIRFAFGLSAGAPTQRGVLITGNNTHNWVTSSISRVNTVFDPVGNWIVANNVDNASGATIAAFTTGSGLGAYTSPPVTNGDNAG